MLAYILTHADHRRMSLILKVVFTYCTDNKIWRSAGESNVVEEKRTDARCVRQLQILTTGQVAEDTDLMLSALP